MSISACVCKPVLNLYAYPDGMSEVVSQALYGWKITIQEDHQNFKYIHTPDGYKGWVEAEGVAIPASLLSPSFSSTQKIVKVNCLSAPVYASPQVNRSKPLLILPFEVELAILSELPEEEGRWIQVELYVGITGWIQRGHVEFTPPKLSLGQMLQLSQRFLGITYIWGGISSFGYDCSGFVQMLWRQMGIFLPRDASQQCAHSACRFVSFDALEPGDLLFFGSSSLNITHVGIYESGQKLIHASVKPIPAVQQSTLESLQSRYAYRTARRFHFSSTS